MNKASLIAILSAVLYGISIPVSKIILSHGINPVVLGGLTYLGAGLGFLIINSVKIFKKEKLFQNPLTINELPYTILMVVFDIFAILLLMFGLSKTNSANASLLSNFEIAATSLIAYMFLKEKVSKKLWCAIILIILASIILTYEPNSFDFTLGSILVLSAYLFWGMENNCTKMLSSKNSQEITVIKGLFSGIGSLIIAFILKANIPSIPVILSILALGFLSYGISVSMYIYSQNKLGAAKTASYFSFAPYIAAIISIIFLFEMPKFSSYIALLILLISGYIIYKDNN